MSTWPYVYFILANHRLPVDADDGAVVNHLWNEASKGVGPAISEKNTTVVSEQWDLQRLASLIQGEGQTEHASFPQRDPPIIVRWADSDYRIDGRRRINELVRSNAPGLHSVLVLHLDNA